MTDVGSALLVEIQKFHRNIRHLRKLQTETLVAIEDVGLSGNLKDGNCSLNFVLNSLSYDFTRLLCL